MDSYFTRSGDDGYTGLLGEGRVPKYHMRPEAYGAVDEASAVLGLARALIGDEQQKAVIRQVQRHLYRVMAELAATPDQALKFRTIGAEQVEWLEGQTRLIGAAVEMPAGFVIGGDSLPGAALDLARTVVRRAERAVARLAHQGELDNPHLLAYLNRLSSLCFVLALDENRRAGFESPTLADEVEP
jgi:cob(I)alamin adenosyltransferase